MHSLLAVEAVISVNERLVLLSKTESVADETPILRILWLDILISSLHLHVCRASPLLPSNLQRKKSFFLKQFHHS